MNTSVNTYFINGCGRCPLTGTPDCKVHRWIDEIQYLCDIANETELKEESKWGVPCYTLEGKIVFTISAFKEYCCVSFFKGILLKDPTGVLQKRGKHSHAERFMRFASLEEVHDNVDHIKAFMQAAIEMEKKGISLPPRKVTEEVPEELLSLFVEDPTLQFAFEELTPGCQRGYLIYISSAKQAKTRVSRIEKCISKIMRGEGLHDKYSNKKR